MLKFFKLIVLAHPTLLFIIKLFFSIHFCLYLFISLYLHSLFPYVSHSYMLMWRLHLILKRPYIYIILKGVTCLTQNLHSYRLENLNRRLTSRSLSLIVSKLKILFDPQNLLD
jgi:hypothetical protein